VPPENGSNSRQLYLRQSFATEPFRRELTSLERVLAVPHALVTFLAPKHGVLPNPLPREKLQQNPIHSWTVGVDTPNSLAVRLIDMPLRYNRTAVTF
jgi:hypothetical protein